jgi:hypothetical protein
MVHKVRGRDARKRSMCCVALDVGRTGNQKSAKRGREKRKKAGTGEIERQERAMAYSESRN